MCRWVLVRLVLLTVGFQVLGCPSVYVIIPEEDRCIVPRPVPDPACETAIIRAFLVHSLHVVKQIGQVKWVI